METLTSIECSPQTLTVTARVVSANGTITRELRLAQEHRLSIVLNGVELIYLLCLPVDLHYLAVGFLYTEGIITSATDISRWELDLSLPSVSITTIDPEGLSPSLFLKRTITSGCGKGVMFRNVAQASRPKVESRFQISRDELIRLWKQISAHDYLYNQTRCVHSSALCSRNAIEYFNADIGRHNTIDRITGKCILEGISRDDKIVLCSGRFSSEMVVKLATSGIGLAVSRSMPTDMAVQMAEDMGVTLAKLDNSGAIIIFSHPERVC